jgi:hypothetical protein
MDGWHVWLTFDSCESIRGERTERRVVDRLFNLLCSAITLASAEQVEFFRTELAEISPSLWTASMRRVAGRSCVAWQASGRVEECDLGPAAAAARKKAQGFPRYRGQFDERWLILQVGGPHPSQWIEPTEERCAAGIVTAFDRVFLVDPASGYVKGIRSHRERAGKSFEGP